MKTTAEMIEVMQAYVRGEEIEVCLLSGSICATVTDPAWNWHRYDYQIAPKTQPSIDWSHVSEEYKWMATDFNGATFLYFEEPGVYGSGWDGFTHTDARTFASFQPGTCDWTDSLVQRPE